MRFAFGACMSPLIAVPVAAASEDGNTNRYVLEIDVHPVSDVCEDIVFQYCDGGKIVAYLHDGRANLEKSNAVFNGKRGNTFEDAVNARIK